MEMIGLLVGDLQGKQPDWGLLVRGENLPVGKIHLKVGSRSARRQLQGIRDLLGPVSPPRLVLNDHCQVCEFRSRCHDQAVGEDNLSLLRGMGEKEVRSYARRGIGTITQLAHTFRPRRKGKRAERKGGRRQHALSALAIRDRRIYVLGTPEIPTGPVAVYFDLEGKPDEGFVYLAGMVIVHGDVEERHSFWADTPEQESLILGQFLDQIERFDDFVVYTYGGYEKSFLTRMRKQADRQDIMDRVLNSLVNVLSLVFSHFYFPAFSNGLKDVGRSLECSWSDDEASGIQSIAWRMRWEASHEETWKRKLTTYNLEDCLALRKVTEFVRAVAAWVGAGTAMPSTGLAGPQVAQVHEIDKLAGTRKWGANRFVHPEYNFINDCAYFDYQRERVFVRTRPALRKRKGRRKKPQHNRALRVSKRYLIVSTNCPSCGSGDVAIDGTISGNKRTRVKRAFDLSVTPGGVRRRVIECRSPNHRCGACGEGFVPKSYRDLDKHSHSLKSWAMYLHVAHRASVGTLSELFKEFFNVGIADMEFVMFKTLLATTYGATCRSLMERMVAGGVLHADETEVKLKTGKGYVWVFSSLREAVYLYKPTREGGFLREMLKDFHGVLVSDFFAAYDALECPQQKCLIHLMRDINQDLLGSPFDDELRSITQPFGTLLKAIVSTVDQYGLRKKHLAAHRGDVTTFFLSLAETSFSSEAAESLRDRMLRNREKLFTFIDHDGVPWNNNVAENAIKRFAYYREDTIGVLTEAGLSDYLVLLSLFQTCRLRGVSFLKFLLSREQNLEDFDEKRRPRRKAPFIEVYPEGFIPAHFAGVRKARKGNDAE
jgi:predicted RecB family nuclease